MHLYISQGEPIDSKKVMSVITDIVSVCREIGLIHLFLILIVRLLRIYPFKSVLLLNLLLLLDSDKFNGEFVSISEKLKPQIEVHLDSVDPYERLELLFGLATHEFHKSNSLSANDYYQRAVNVAQSLAASNTDISHKAVKLLTINSWNLGCNILKLQDFNKGWQLFEYGPSNSMCW